MKRQHIDDAEQAAFRAEKVDQLFGYAKLLWESVKWLSAPPEQKTLYRGAKMSLVALDRLRAAKGRVIAFPTFMNFSETLEMARQFPLNPPRPTEQKVFFKFESIARHRTGGLSAKGTQGEGGGRARWLAGVR